MRSYTTAQFLLTRSDVLGLWSNIHYTRWVCRQMAFKLTDGVSTHLYSVACFSDTSLCCAYILYSRRQLAAVAINEKPFSGLLLQYSATINFHWDTDNSLGWSDNASIPLILSGKIDLFTFRNLRAQFTHLWSKQSLGLSKLPALMKDFC
jgi:hypothetical protein